MKAKSWIKISNRELERNRITIGRISKSLSERPNVKGKKCINPSDVVMVSDDGVSSTFERHFECYKIPRFLNRKQ